jgi:hypothetical protein
MVRPRSISRALLVGLIALLALLMAAGPADARKRRSKRASNMPAGWSWPPTPKMKRVGDACLAHLDELGVAWKKGQATRKITTPIVVKEMELGGLKLVSIFRKPPFTMDCHLAVALVEHGPKLYELGVRELRFSSIHRYTRVRVNGKTGRALSKHALGLAIDVWSFVDDQGLAHVVEQDYLAGDPLLHAVEDAVNASGGFRLVLTPANDPVSHHDHFHLEAKVDYTTAPRLAARRAPR